MNSGIRDLCPDVGAPYSDGREWYELHRSPALDKPRFPVTRCSPHVRGEHLEGGISRVEQRKVWIIGRKWVGLVR